GGAPVGAYVAGSLRQVYHFRMDAQTQRIATTNALGFIGAKAIALAVQDLSRANHFYRDILGAEPSSEGGLLLGDTHIFLKEDWYAPPTTSPNPRVTFEVEDARRLEETLTGRGVAIADRVELYDGQYYIGSFLDSEGNKLWVCSAR
ncbi:MAG TPA: VOC family protein, partial [bacterium]|nr:VOC family protein [bacterium]